MGTVSERTNYFAYFLLVVAWCLLFLSMRFTQLPDVNGALCVGGTLTACIGVLYSFVRRGKGWRPAAICNGLTVILGPPFIVA